VTPQAAAGATLLLLGAAIAAIAGFDNAFNAVTLGLPLLRAALFAILTLAGFFLARRAGLSLLAKAIRHPFATPAGIGFAVALALALLDCYVFRAQVPAAYIDFVKSEPLGIRLLYFCTRAFSEEVLYRLFLTSAIVCAARASIHQAGDGVYWTAIIAAQVLAIATNAPLPASPDAHYLLYMLLRTIAPGIIWGFLYWRHGLATALTAHIATHVFLQPITGIALAN